MIAQTAVKVREQLDAFSERLSSGLSKPARRFVREALYGIAARGSVKLSEIGRALEEPIALIKTETRLSRNLKRPELAEIGDAVLAEGAGRIGERTLLILDLSDITKRYAEKMEHLARVRDGSEGTIADGYWTAHVVGVENEDNTIFPLYASLWSQEAPDFVSENEEILAAVRTVATACHGRGVWVIDRGGDRGELYAPLIEEGHAFVVRNKGDRHLLIGHSPAGTARGETEALALSCPMHFATHIVREQAGQEVSHRLDYGFRPVRLPAHPRTPLWLVVVRGLGEKPLMLLTNIQVKRNRKSLWWMVAAYLTRWRIEETIRFIKQSYELEDIRVLSYRRLRNMVVLVNAVAYFTTSVIGTRMKLEILATHLIKASKRLFGIPDFRYYAIADGIREVCARSPRRAPRPPDDMPQLAFGFP